MKFELEILLPVFNEVEYIEKLFKGIHQAIKKKISYRFLVCEDGSTDGTKELLKKLKKKYNIKLISKEKRKGFSREAISEILEAHRLYFRADLKSDEALRIIEETYGDRREIREFLDFMQKTEGSV